MKYLSELKFRMTGGRAALLSAIVGMGIIPLTTSKQWLYCDIFSLGLCTVRHGIGKVHF